VYCWLCSEPRARAGKINSPKPSEMLDFSGRTVASNACHFAFVSPAEGVLAGGVPAIHAAPLTGGKKKPMKCAQSRLADPWMTLGQPKWGYVALR
jgi:hypothetical protein